MPGVVGRKPLECRPRHHQSRPRCPIRIKYLHQTLDSELDDFKPNWTILHCPDVEATPADGIDGATFIITELTSGTTLIGGTRYLIKSKRFSLCKTSAYHCRNFDHARRHERVQKVLDIHAGLSGTGKTTLSIRTPRSRRPDRGRHLRQRSETIISNMEGGQYAKTRIYGGKNPGNLRCHPLRYNSREHLLSGKWYG